MNKIPYNVATALSFVHVAIIGWMLVRNMPGKKRFVAIVSGVAGFMGYIDHHPFIAISQGI